MILEKIANGNDWIKVKLSENDFNAPAVYKMYEQFLRETNSTSSVSTFESRVRQVRVKLRNQGELDDCNIDNGEQIALDSVSLQKLRDANARKTKFLRETNRQTIISQDIYETLKESLKELDFSKFSFKEHKMSDGEEKFGVLQITDTHFNEIIEGYEGNGNVYDFSIASKRLKKFILKAKDYFKFNRIKSLYIFLTGDLINSSRRIDELTSQATSQARASVLVFNIFLQMLAELNKDFNIQVAHVVGNESRIEQEKFSFSELQATQNYDHLIFEMLATSMEHHKVKGIKFLTGASCLETVVSFPNGFNALLIHGNTFKNVNNIEVEIDGLKARYSSLGIHISAVFFGHFHSAFISDCYARSGSLCGGNAYSSKDLKFVSRASQNVYIVNSADSFDGLKIDLQDISDVKEGYNLVEKLEEYNVRKAVAVVDLKSHIAE
jgi:hypothetical protein